MQGSYVPSDLEFRMQSGFITLGPWAHNLFPELKIRDLVNCETYRHQSEQNIKSGS